MEMEEMQSLWKSMSQELNNQKKLTDKLIIDMTQQRYTNRFKKISIYEGAGAIVCFAAALYILLNIGKLDTWYLMLSGVITLAVLITLPIVSLWSIDRMKSLDLSKNTYKETLIKFASYRNQFLMLQRLAAYMAFALVFTALPVASKIKGDKDIFLTNTATLYWFIPVMLVFLFFFVRWGYSCYSGITKSAERVLQELDES